MPKLALEVTTSAGVALSPKLLKKLKVALTTYRTLKAQCEDDALKCKTQKDTLEILFADAGETDALENGVRVQTPFGEVPMKIVRGKTAPRLNVQKVIKKFKLTPGDLEDCYDEAKDKAPYLGVYLPNDEGDDDDDDAE